MAETIGQQLKQAREARNLTIEKVVQATHMRARHIEAIEADDFESLPSPVQARAFLRLYAEFLGLSLDNLIARQREGLDEAAVPLPEPEPVPDQSEEPDPVEPAASAAKNIGASIADKGKVVWGNLKSLFVRIAQTVTSRLKRPARPVNPAGEDTLSDSESEASSNPVIAADETGVDGSALVEAEDPLPPGDEASSPEPRQSHLIIFASIGEALRQRRKSLSLTMDEIERHTHVRKHYLLALEAGEFDHLPSSVQTRGMLNNYARFLDMDVDAILLKFAEGLQTRRVERQPRPVETPQKPGAKFPIKINLPPALRRYLSTDILVGGGLILLLLIFAVWGTGQIIRQRSTSAPQPTAPSISDILQTPPAAGTVTPLSTEAAGAGTVVPLPGVTVVATNPAPSQGSVQVVVVALESVWVRVTVDGKVQFTGRITPNAAYSYGGNTQIEVLTGSGAAVRILYNQSDLGPMGNLGEVVDRIYTATTILNPTPTSTPTITVSPVPSATPRPSPTLRASITPRNSPTPTP